MLEDILVHFVIYIKIIKNLDNRSIKHLELSNKAIYNIINNYGYRENIKIIRDDRKYINKLYNSHKRTIKYITIYNQNNGINLLPNLYKDIDLRLISCYDVNINKKYSKIIKLMIIGQTHKIKAGDLNNLKNLKNLGIEYLENSNKKIILDKLEILRIYGKIKINMFMCKNIIQIFYYLTPSNMTTYLDFTFFKKMKLLIIFMTIYTQIKFIKLCKSIQHIKIIINNIVYEKKFYNSNNEVENDYHRQIKNIEENEDNYTIYPVQSYFNNYYYY